ncbi:MAG: GNAT family N-acetyltransferase [Pseudomonadota bacterium]
MSVTQAHAPWTKPWPGPPAHLTAQIAGCVPALETDSLIMRAPRLSDYPIYSGFVRADRGAGLARGDFDRPSWHDFCEMVAGWALRGFGPWTLETKSDAEPVGLIVIGLEYGDPEPEIGWLVTPEAEGCGYATEAASRALRWAFESHGFATLVSFIDHDHNPSIRVAERLGAMRDPVAEAELDCRVYRHRAGGTQQWT